MILRQKMREKFGIKCVSSGARFSRKSTLKLVHLCERFSCLLSRLSSSEIVFTSSVTR